MSEHGAVHVSCREVVALVADYFDDVLDDDSRSLFEEHLNFCEGCVSYLHQLRTTIDAMGQLREEDVSDEATRRLLTALRDWRRT